MQDGGTLTHIAQAEYSLAINPFLPGPELLGVGDRDGQIHRTPLPV